jgi:hypothetical protein
MTFKICLLGIQLCMVLILIAGSNSKVETFQLNSNQSSSFFEEIVSNKLYFASKPDVPGDEYHQKFGRFDPSLLQSIIFREIEFGKSIVSSFDLSSITFVLSYFSTSYLGFILFFIY